MSFKDDFHQACLSVGGQWIEDASDGSFTCSLPNDGSIHCRNESCTFTTFFDHNTGVEVIPTNPGIRKSVYLSPGSGTRISIDLTRVGVGELLNFKPTKD
jgi:hypothetical protein